MACFLTFGVSLLILAQLFDGYFSWALDLEWWGGVAGRRGSTLLVCLVYESLWIAFPWAYGPPTFPATPRTGSQSQ